MTDARAASATMVVGKSCPLFEFVELRLFVAIQ